MTNISKTDKISSKNMRAYIVGGYIPNGGTYMAYQLGRILHEDHGIEVIIVNVNEETPNHNIFYYPFVFDTIHLKDLESTTTLNDLLIVNPSFSSHMIGLNCLGKKLMYVQDFKTFSIIDGFFDYYVSVSQFVADFLYTTYHLKAPVIPACIFLRDFPPSISWNKKSDKIIVPILKHQPYIKAVLNEFCSRYKEQFFDIQNKMIIIDKKIDQNDLINLINQHRYLLSLSPAEGFGLVPLEAMACGTAVIGFDGMGGTEYMHDNINSSTSRYPDIEGLVIKTHQLLSDPSLAEKIAKNGKITAQKYDFPYFRERWNRVFEQLIN